MFSFISRDVRRTRAFTIAAVAALSACADEPVAPKAPRSLAPSASQTSAVVITVTNNSGGSDAGSLRWALAQATGGETIRFDPSLDGDTIIVDPTLEAWQWVTIEGPQAKGITISGGGKVRVINLHQGAWLRNVTITNGYHPVFAGGLWSPWGVELRNSTVSNNSAPYAGGMYVNSAMLINSTVAGNTADYLASAISFDYAGGFAMNNSTVARNGPAPGIVPHGNSTINPRPYFQNSIVAYNGTPRMNCAQIFEFRYVGSNLSDDASCGAAPNVLVADPMLGVLRDNGGPTATIDFAPHSPALDLGRLCAYQEDQRYVPRDAFCDVGAFEFTDYTKVTITIAPGVKADRATGKALLTGNVQCTRNDAFRLALELHQDQKIDGQVVDVHAASDIPIVCTTSPTPWSATMALVPGEAFKTGAARAIANTFNTPAWVTPAGVESAVKITVSRK
ncbi:MAG TPA: right-handed parallel beta-helix repeat-containing protein [Gemmatimonadaceae bacterium]|nr:right-handed parallel beta-helix repeat-containing protein [Gemmatimonadaceae bacterium]